MATAEIKISPETGRGWAQGPWRARFEGPRATVREITVEADAEGLLYVPSAGNSRRFRPLDPLWWLRDASDPAEATIEVELIQQEG